MISGARVFHVVLVATAVIAHSEVRAQESAAEDSPFGVLLMAHGGTPEWDAAIATSAASLREELPIAIAYGMADPYTMQHALDSLRARGVERVAVVRMFVSGASFLPQTEYLLGLSTARPAFFMPSHHPQAGGHAGHDGGHAAAPAGPPEPIAHGLTVATHRDGLVDAGETHRIFAERAAALSANPQTESVLLIAHGMGDQQENDDLLAAMRDIEREISRHPFHTVRSATLREDWPPARAIAEREIRAFVESENQAGRRVIVIPVRLSGFGPYAEVLDGLEYATGEALLPHEEVATWLRRTAAEIARANGWLRDARPAAD